MSWTSICYITKLQLYYNPKYHLALFTCDHDETNVHMQLIKLLLQLCGSIDMKEWLTPYIDVIQSNCSSSQLCFFCLCIFQQTTTLFVVTGTGMGCLLLNHKNIDLLYTFMFPYHNIACLALQNRFSLLKHSTYYHGQTT